MGKADHLVQNLGERMAESVGPREITSDDRPEASGLRYDGVTRLEDAGEIPLANLVADPDQPREEFLDADLDLLAESIRAHGVLQPLRARWAPELGKYKVIMGARRLLAAERAGMVRVPVICTEAPLDPITLLEQQLAENLCRTDLNDMERAQAFRRYLELKSCRAVDLARFLHISEATVSKTLSLTNLDPVVQEKVASGTISAKVGHEIAKLENPEAQKRVAAAAVAAGLPADKVKAKVRQQAGKAPRGRESRPVERTIQLEKGLSVIIRSRSPLADAEVTSALERALEEVRRR